MNDARVDNPTPSTSGPPADAAHAAELKRLRRRYRADRRFKVYTIVAMSVGAAFLVVFLADLVFKGVSALRQTEVRTTITYNADSVGKLANPRLAYPEEMRPIVSRTRTRTISNEGQRLRLLLDVAFTEQTASNPAGSIQPITLERDAFFVDDLREGAPYRFTAAEVRGLVGEPGLQEIRDRLAENPRLVGRTERMWVWAAESFSDFFKRGGDDRRLLRWCRQLEAAGRAELALDTVRLGEDGTMTVEEWVLANSEVDQYVKGKSFGIRNDATEYERVMAALGREPVPSPDEGAILDALADPEANPAVMDLEKRVRNMSGNRLNELVAGWNLAQRIDRLQDEGKVRLVFNTYFFTAGDSQHPEAAGILPAVVGSVMILALVFVLAVPIGVMTSIYLEEFAPDNLLTQTIEVNINNLAAIPSILFGVLGLYAFINTMGMPRSSALVGGVTLALMTLPIIIISTRAALRAVPDSIRRAGFAMGATRWQVVTHHVLPQSISGILTGSIIGLAQAMGETAPLIIIGLIVFAGEPPSGIADTTTAMPAQIFRWWGESQRAFDERAALAILCLLLVLFAMNALAVYLRARSEKRW